MTTSQLSEKYQTKIQKLTQQWAQNPAEDLESYLLSLTPRWLPRIHRKIWEAEAAIASLSNESTAESNPLWAPDASGQLTLLF